MSSVALHKAINQVWTDSVLDWLFRQRWSGDSQDAFASLNDTEAAPGTPFPYCVYLQGASTTNSRASGHEDGEKHEIRDVPWTFRIYAQQSSTESAKVIASTLAEHVLRIFGGYPDPSIAPQELQLETGRCLLAQYQTDYGVKLDETEYMWAIEYLYRVDMPVAI